MSELCSKFQITASNTVGGVAKTRTVWSKYVCYIRGYNSAIMTRSKKTVFFMHIFSACLNCVASFKALHQRQVVETQTVLERYRVKIYMSFMGT